MRRPRQLGVLAGLWVLWAACQPSECVTAVVDAVQIGFFRVETVADNNLNEQPLRIRLDSLRASGLPLFTLAEDSLASLRIPLSPGDTTVTFLLYRGALADTLTIVYDNNLELISHECGFQPRYEIKTLTLTDADSVRIVRATLTTADELNVRIFL